jgi:hypothetical protein
MSYLPEHRKGLPLRIDHDAARGAERRDFLRGLACRVLGQLRNEPPERIARKAWRDENIPLVARAPSPPMAAPQPFSQTRVGDFLLVAPTSAAAQLFDRCMKLDFNGIYQITVPYAASHATPLWTGEGLPLNVVRSPVATTAVGPVKKFGFITTATRELLDASPENVAQILGRLLGEAAAKTLDAAVFSTTAADATRPAGLLAGVSAQTGVTGATTADSAAADLAAFAQAMSDAYINPANMIIITSPASRVNLDVAMGYPTEPLTILASPAVPRGTAIAIAPEAVAVGYEGEPEIIITEHPPMHMDDAVAQELVTSGGVVASPQMSPFQKYMVAIRLMVRATWQQVQPGAVQYATGTKW